MTLIDTANLLYRSFKVLFKGYSRKFSIYSTQKLNRKINFHLSLGLLSISPYGVHCIARIYKPTLLSFMSVDKKKVGAQDGYSASMLKNKKKTVSEKLLDIRMDLKCVTDTFFTKEFT